MKNYWSANKTSIISRTDGVDHSFFHSMINSTRAGEDDYSYPAVVSANSSILGSRHLRMSQNVKTNALRESNNPTSRDTNNQPIKLRDEQGF